MPYYPWTWARECEDASFVNCTFGASGPCLTHGGAVLVADEDEEEDDGEEGDEPWQYAA